MVTLDRSQGSSRDQNPRCRVLRHMNTQSWPVASARAQQAVPETAFCMCNANLLLIPTLTRVQTRTLPRRDLSQNSAGYCFRVRRRNCSCQSRCSRTQAASSRRMICAPQETGETEPAVDQPICVRPTSVAMCAEVISELRHRASDDAIAREPRKRAHRQNSGNSAGRSCLA